MATSVKVVTAYIDLGLTKRPSSEFHELGHDLLQALDLDGVCYLRDFSDCWVTKEPGISSLPAANKRAEDRFANDTEHVMSNMIQHSPMQWLREAYTQFDVDVYVWMGYSLLKQGDFTGKRITQQHVREFVKNLKSWDPVDIPFPGMADTREVNVHGDNWRWCGSVLVFPSEYLAQAFRDYKTCARWFFRTHECIPLDLAIWPHVEKVSSMLPFRQYKTEYDYTQLTNFPFKG